eukprot:6743940-Pyramimonas_sp.AAC.1
MFMYSLALEAQKLPKRLVGTHIGVLARLVGGEGDCWLSSSQQTCFGTHAYRSDTCALATGSARCTPGHRPQSSIDHAFGPKINPGMQLPSYRCTLTLS